MTYQDVSVLIPTRNRVDQIRRKVQRFLAESCVGQVVVVVDGSTDGTVEALKSIDDSRLKIVINEEAVGPSRARNVGFGYVTGSWVALLDDDDYHSVGFLSALKEVATDNDAAIVGAPWLNVETGADPDKAFEHAPRGEFGPTLLSPSIVPETDGVQCLWIPNNVLVRRSVLQTVRFDEGYLGNFWREETDFFVSAVRSGHKVVVTNRAYSYQFEKPSGGIVRSNRLMYEFWVARNDIRFMFRHGSWLRDQGHIDGIARFLWNSMVRRVRPLVGQLMRKLGVRGMRRSGANVQRGKVS